MTSWVTLFVAVLFSGRRWDWQESGPERRGAGFRVAGSSSADVLPSTVSDRDTRSLSGDQARAGHLHQARGPRWRSPARCGRRARLKQGSIRAQSVAGTLARVNLVAGRLLAPAPGEALSSPPPGLGPARECVRSIRGVTGGNRRHGRRGSGRLCGQSGWRHRIVPGAWPMPSSAGPLPHRRSRQGGGRCAQAARCCGHRRSRSGQLCRRLSLLIPMVPWAIPAP